MVSSTFSDIILNIAREGGKAQPILVVQPAHRLHSTTTRRFRFPDEKGLALRDHT
jgi:hypothetical protein